MAELVTPIALIKHIEFAELSLFKEKKISSNNRNTAYKIGGIGDEIEGTPDINWQDIVIILKEGIIYTCGRIMTCMSLHGNVMELTEKILNGTL